MLYNSMKMLFVLTFAMVGTIFHSSAQSQAEFSLESAINHALEYNKTLVNASLAVNESRARLKETIAQGLPQVNATIDYNNFFGSTASLGAFPGMEIEFNPTSNLSISAGQLIFSGSYIVGIQMARLYTQITETSLEKTELDIKAQATQAYYLCLISRRSEEVMQANLNNIKDLLEKTKAMVSVGIAEELDYDQLQVQSGMLENALRAAERQVELSLNLLRLQMGLSAEADVVLTDELDDIIGRLSFNASAAQSFSLEKNLDYQLLQLQTGIAAKQVNMEKAAYLPTITGFYNFTEKLLKPEFDLQPNHVIGFNVNIPIFSSGARYARVSQARINHEIARNQNELVAEQLMIQEKQLRFNLNNALEQYQSQLANLEVARRVIKNINNKFEQGMVSSLDLTTANSNYLQAENSYISSLFQLMEAQTAMDKLLNTF